MIAYAVSIVALVLALVLAFVPALAGAEAVTPKLSSFSSEGSLAHVSLMRPSADAINGDQCSLVKSNRELDGKLSPGDGRWACFEQR